MINKTFLLEKVLDLADKLRKDDGRKAVSSNYFILAFLNFCDKADSSIAADEAIMQEVIDTKDLFVTYHFQMENAVQKISEALKDPEYSSAMDEILFKKLVFSVETLAMRSKAENLSTSDYMAKVLSEPTKIIDSLLDKESDEMGTFVQEMIDTLKAEDAAEDKEEAEAQNTDISKGSVNAETDTEKDNTFNVSELVKSTQKIRKELLESVFGQDQAINTFVAGYFQSELMAEARKDSKKPQATFLFAGPPGVGKTFLAEKTAEAVGLPFKRFDMSEYSNGGVPVLCGSESFYKNSAPGTLTDFAAKNPHCIILFDEIEKAGFDVIQLFLQVLDAGRLKDAYTQKEVPFTRAIMIFTTNVGKNLYNDPTVTNLSALPRKAVLSAISSDVGPRGVPLFPAAICSRFASGNVIMFNRLGARDLFTIAKRTLLQNASALESSLGITIDVDDKVATAIILSEGKNVDARTVKGRANNFFYEELYELFRLLGKEKNTSSIDKLNRINIKVSFEGDSKKLSGMFVNERKPEVLVFADGNMAKETVAKLEGLVCHVASNLEDAKNILFNNDISIVLCDVKCGAHDNLRNLLNLDDLDSEGRRFITYVTASHSLPVYLIQHKENEITQEEFLSFTTIGVSDILATSAKKNSFSSQVLFLCDVAYQQENMLKLARESKVLTYKTSQTVTKSKKTADIYLFELKTVLAKDTGDPNRILDSASKPTLRFDDVIGAEDAKQELAYFVDYLKNPVKFLRKGVRVPKGILLYGPPGTGKTLLAKAMAGESDVTFLVAEGNQFLKKYVGEGPEAIHSLFASARRYAPSIIFIDEIDSIGANRSSADGSSKASADVLTALLTEMDGFNVDTAKPVFVLAATNYEIKPNTPRSLDPALLRRFDRKIYVDLPNKEERKKYLLMKISKYSSVSLSEEQIDNIALRSTGMSLAELESVFEMALRSAIRSQNGIVTDEAFEEAFESFNNGEKKQWKAEELERTARHEAGHALLCWLSGQKPTYVTVVARGDHGGYVQHANSEDKGSYTKSELLDRIRISLAGRAAEIVYYGEDGGISTGASGDLYSATRTAEHMICTYGMDGSVGLSYISTDAIGVSGELRNKVNSILADELKNAVELISKNKAAIDAMTAVLIEKNHLKENEIDEVFKATALI